MDDETMAERITRLEVAVDRINENMMEIVSVLKTLKNLAEEMHEYNVEVDRRLAKLESSCLMPLVDN